MGQAGTTRVGPIEEHLILLYQELAEDAGSPNIGQHSSVRLSP